MYVIRLEVDINQPIPIHVKEVQRSKKCVVLYFDSTLNHCPVCKEAIKKQQLKDKRFAKNIKTPAKPNAPLSNTHPDKVKLALINERIKCSQLEKDIARMKSEIKLSGITRSPDLSNDVVKIMNESQCKFMPFVKLFWEQQKVAFKKKSLSCTPPPDDCFCISLASKSPSACDGIRDSNILALPSRRTPGNYRNAIRPKVGFNQDMIDGFKNVTKHLNGIQRFICLCFDEIKVQSSLVFSEYTDELIGFR